MKKQIFWILSIVLSLQLMPFSISASQPETDLDSASFLYSSDESIDALEKALPSTVLILTKEDYFDLYHGPNPNLFYQTIRPLYELLCPPYSSFRGSGFFISEDGYIVTNEHVIGDATEVLVAVQDMEPRIMKASIIGKDSRSDIAVLKIENNQDLKFPYLKFADSNKAKIGEPVMAIGNPFSPALESTVTTGVISAKNRNNIGGVIENYIQIDAAINGGNSGGPLLNLKGEVIGVNVRGCRWFLEGLNFSIPSNTVNHIAKVLISKGEAAQGFLGVELDQTKAETFDLDLIDLENGALIKKLVQGSPAKKAGLEKGDLILQINEYTIKSAKDLKNQVVILEPDTNIELTVDRQGKKMHISLQLGSEELSKKHSSLGYKLVI